MSLFWLPTASEPLALAAELYAANGWSIFPLRGKQPLTRNGLKDASCDPERVRSWWREYPDANIGWTVPRGWFALDVDVRHGGVSSLRELEMTYGPLPMTLRQVTGTGGEHWIYRVPAGVEIRQLASFRPGLDTRADGRGYLVIAPSIHHDTGRPYSWAAAVDPVEPPGWLLGLVKAPPPIERRPYVPPPPGRALEKREREARLMLRGMAKKLAGEAKGNRNELLNWCWFKIAEFRDVVSLDESAAVLREAALSAGLAEREADKVLRR